jgi:Cu(I)/Ag(I) efflux system protein CusF
VQATGRTDVYKHYNLNPTKGITMKTFSKLAIATIAALSCAATAVAQEAGHGSHGAHGTPSASAPNAAKSVTKGAVAGQLVDGEVKKVDKEAGKVTLRHGELKALAMPAMTMVFRAKDPAMLDQVKVGDKVKFIAEKIDGAITVVHLEHVK